MQLKNYGLIDDVFTDLVRDAQGRATMTLEFQREGTAGDPRAEVPDRAAVVHAAGRGRRRSGGVGSVGQAAPRRGTCTLPGPFPVDPSAGSEDGSCPCG